MALFKLKPVEPIDFASLVRPTSPNTFLLCPPGFSAAHPDQEAPIFDLTPEALRQAWDKMIANQPRTEELDRSADNLQRTYVQRTALMGYPDITTVQFITLDEARSTVVLYSRSQYGYSDLGANRKRVTAWLRDLVKIVEHGG